MTLMPCWSHVSRTCISVRYHACCGTLCCSLGHAQVTCTLPFYAQNWKVMLAAVRVAVWGVLECAIVKHRENHLCGYIRETSTFSICRKLCNSMSSWCKTWKGWYSLRRACTPHSAHRREMSPHCRSFCIICTDTLWLSLLT